MRNNIDYSLWENLEPELRKLSRKIGSFPTVHQLEEMKKGNLYKAIWKYHGGIDRVRERLGYEKPKFYLEDLENLKKELHPVIKDLGHFPSHRELFKLGKSSIGNAILRYHGGFNTVRKKLGYDLIHVSPGYWKDFENIEERLNTIIKELNHFPTQQN